MDAAIEHVRSGKHDPKAHHEAIEQMYSWADVAARTEKVYQAAMSTPLPDRLERFER